MTKSKRVLNASGVLQSTVETDPFSADTSRSSNAAFRPKKYTSDERDYNGTDEATFRRYNRWHARFDQPDPYEGSYVLTNPQSFNRYAYVNNDPANFVDPTGLWCTIYWTQYSDGSVEVREVGCEVTVYSGGGFTMGGGDRVTWFAYMIADTNPGDTGTGGEDVPYTKSEDKIPQKDMPNVDNPFLTDCKEIGEIIRDITKSVRRRRVELDPASDSYQRHVTPWASQKNELNKAIQKFRDNNCDDSDLPPGFPVADAEVEAAASPRKSDLTNLGEQQNRGALILPVLVLGTIFPFLAPAATGPVAIPAYAR